MVLFTISEVMFFLRSFILVYYRLLALGDVGALLIRAKKHTLVALILTIILAFLFTVYWWRGKYIMKKIFNENENGSIERAPQIKARPTQYRKTNNTDKKKDTQIASPQPKIYRQKGPILTDLNDEDCLYDYTYTYTYRYDYTYTYTYTYRYTYTYTYTYTYRYTYN